MKLTGYIKELKDFSFAIPIYSEANRFFYHILDSDLKIEDFVEIDKENALIESLYLSTEFTKGSYGAIVFIGKGNYKLFNEGRSIIDEVIKYLYDTTPPDTLKYIKAEAEVLKQYLNERDSSNLLKITKEIRELTVKDPVFLHVKIYSEGSAAQKVKIVPMTETDEQRIIKYSEDQSSKTFDEYDDNTSQRESLQKRIEDRRRQLKEFNYKFNVNINDIEPIDIKNTRSSSEE